MAEKDKESWLDAALVLGALGIVAFVVIAPLTADQAAQMYLYLKARGGIA